MNCLQTSYRELSSCHEKNEKKRCPFCASLRTKRKGFVKSFIKTKRGRVSKKTQRYFCNECGKNLSSNSPGKRKRASDDLKDSAVSDYVTTKYSLSEVGKRCGVHASTVHRWLINHSGRNSRHNHRFWKRKMLLKAYQRNVSRRVSSSLSRSFRYLNFQLPKTRRSKYY